MLSSQEVGDTVFIQTFNYDSKTRDTTVYFPTTDLSYEKIIMSYNMRCKGAKVSTVSDRNLGCGEWDYSCNTYIVDSSKIEEVAVTHPEYIISDHEDDIFYYTSEQTYTYWQYELQDIVVNKVIEENEFVVGEEMIQTEEHLDQSQQSGKSVFLYTKEELQNSGLTAGAINGIKLYNQGESVVSQFFNVKVKPTTAIELDASNIDLAGMTEVFSNHYVFETGENRFLFADAYEWDGESSLLFEISFTNSTPASTDLQLMGTTTSNNSSLYAYNNYAVQFDEGSRIDFNTDGFSSIEKELTVAFWSYGDETVLPRNTTFLYGYETNIAQRDLNIHLPWSNGSVFFDCGFEGGYDRISKGYQDDDYSGQWNHWAFSKNVNTGVLSIYLNGQLSASTTGNSRDISIENLVMGSDPNGNNSYPGKIREFSVWNKSLNEAEIGDWINVPLNDQHPQYEYLLAYYPMSEGQADKVVDVVNQTESQGTNLSWIFERGTNLINNFKVSQQRPKVSFLRGQYGYDVVEVLSIDSLPNNPNLVEKYIIESNAGQLKDDEVVLESSFLTFEATPEILYDGETNEVISETIVTEEGSIENSELDYTRRFPFYNEIMSFVTPYGINLDLGGNGKTWYFDVTDFTPILKGEKGLKMTLGGQFQEEMDVSFWFIVGTPPRDVVDFNQIWQGTNRIGQARINDIVADTKITPIEVDIPGNAESFKLRSTITGHGAQGEFGQNGGDVFHFINVDGGYEENFWDVNQECSENPIYPQGGTWVYDRQGWCPGEASHIEELDLTESLEPGTTSVFDYGCSIPDNPGGDYRYHMAHQLVSYGAINHQLDAAIIDVVSPSDKAVHSRLNPSCTDPTIQIQNTGADDIEELVIEYWINDGSNKETFTWTGKLDFGESENIVLADGAIWASEVEGINQFYAEIVAVNGSSDDYSHNDTYQSPFTAVEHYDSNFFIEVKTNNASAENQYDFYKDNKELIFSNNLSGVNKVYRDTFSSAGCHTFILQDFGDDGLAWWANPNQGTGYARLRDVNGEVLQEFEADFGGSFQYSFRTSGEVSSEEELSESMVAIIPNPNTGNFVVQGNNLHLAKIELYDMSGKQLIFDRASSEDELFIQTRDLSKGIYILKVVQDQKSIFKRIVVQ